MSASFARRRFLSLGVASAGALVLPLGCGSNDAHGDDARTRAFFPQSVASFDPRPTSVVLWTRVVDPDHAGDTVSLELEVALDAAFAQTIELDGQPARSLSADPASDHCVSVRIDALSPATTYYYRFRYRAAGGEVTSLRGRTKTAPDPASDVGVRFGVICCQDYSGRYYHALRKLAGEDIDFVLHLGDYVYETTSTAADAPSRRVIFGAPEDALVIGANDLAARSLDNYRDLYRTYRGDPDLQKLHESFAMVVIGDDHEYSDDCWGATANYFDGRRNETDLARRAAADQAWSEYMPLDFTSETTLPFDPTLPFPDNMTVYRSFVFGKNLELVITDLRRYRPDHLVPENALPGAIFLTASDRPDIPVSEFVPFVAIDTFAAGVYRAALVNNADALDLDPTSLTGNVSVPWINAELSMLATADLPPAIDPATPDLELGYAYHQLLKTSQFSRIGARYLLAEAPFQALAAAAYAESNGEAERMFGDAQRAWFLDTLKNSSRTFKVWGSEVAFMPRVIDLSPYDSISADLRRRLQLSAEDWDGFPDERRALLAEISQVPNVVVLSGDLHCFFAGTPANVDTADLPVIEIVTSAVSSLTWLDGVRAIVSSDPTLPASVALLANAVGTLLQAPDTKPNPHLAYEQLSMNGFTLVSVSAAELDAELFMIEPADVSTAPDALKGALDTHFQTQKFRVRVDSRTLEREQDGAFQRWDVASASWLSS